MSKLCLRLIFPTVLSALKNRRVTALLRQSEPDSLPVISWSGQVSAASDRQVHPRKFDLVNWALLGGKGADLVR